MDWAKFQIQSDIPEKHFEMKPCLRIIFFLDGKRARVKHGVMHFYEKALSIIGQQCKYHFKPFKARYDSEGYVKYAKNNKSTYRYVPDYFSGKLKEEPFGIDFETSNSVYGISDRAFQIEHSEGAGQGFVCLMLPVDYFGGDHQKLAELANELAGELPFFSGYAGYGVNIGFDGQSIRRYKETPVFKLSQKYLGVDFRMPHDVVQIENPRGDWQSIIGRVSNIAWITYLCKKLIAKRMLRKSDDIVVHRFSQGGGYQIFKSPSVLSSSDQKLLRPYQRLSKCVQRREKDTAVFRLDHVGGEENTNRWLYRFLK